ncbi:MAG: hypothetical protein ACSHW0_05085 [Thalassotalea sp.]
MKSYVKNSLLLCLLLTGCAQTQIPYELAKSVEKDYRLGFLEIPLGVTQEKISDTEYRITARLTEVSTKKRAKSMAFYRAAILAEEQGYDAIFVSGTSGSDGCSRSTTRYGRLVATTDGRAQMSPSPIHTTSVSTIEPRSGVLITLMDSEKTGKRKRKSNRFHLAKDIKEQYQVVIDHVPSAAELEQISEDNLVLCQKKAEERKARFNNQK